MPINSNFSYMKPSKRRSFMRLLSKKAEGMEKGRKERAGKDSKGKGKGVMSWS